MGKTRTFAVAALAAAMVALAAKASLFSTSAYVQDGLIACWDGICNAGVGVHADNVTVWKDVIGGYEFNLTNVAVNANCMTFAGSATSYGILSSSDTVSTFVAATNGTLEIVYASRTGTGNQVLLQSTDSSGLAFGILGGNTILPHAASTDRRRSKFSFSSGTATNSVSVRYTGGAPVSAIANGEALSSLGIDYWGDPGTETFIGVRKSKSTTFPGSIYCIRLYSRQLTDDEIAANRMVDQLRFMLDPNSALMVSTAPALMGSPIPANGLVTGLAAGDTREVSCGVTVYTNAARTAEYRCTGWKLYNANDAVVASGPDTSFTYEHPTPAEYHRLEWQWDVSRRFTDFSNYVQDGLIACWDGICNAGVGVHADNVTVWKDVVGGYEFALTGVTVDADRMTFAGTMSDGLADSYGILSAADTASTFIAATNGTMEIVYRSTKTDNQVLLQAPHSAGIAFGIYENSKCFIAFSSSTVDLWPMFSFGSGTALNSASVRYASRIPISAIGNGSTLGTGAGSYWGSPGTETYLGARASRLSEFFAGSIYAVRLYSRQLTDTEIAANQRLDHLRFENDLSDTMLIVSGAPEGIGSPSPGYGYICELSAGATRAVSCGEVPWKDASDDNKYSCVGWKLYDANGAVVGNGSSRSFTYTHPTPAAHRRLEWQWRDTSTLGTFLLLR